MFTYVILLSTMGYTAIALVSVQDMEVMKNEFSGLENNLHYTYKMALVDMDNIIASTVTAVKNSGQNEKMQCISQMGKRFMVDVEEKVREACMHLIATCRNFLEMLNKGDLNQEELLQAEEMIRENSSFKQQIYETNNFVKNYMLQKSIEFNEKAEKCY
ncbi:uncharacterized protein [Rhodnius prolixus]|uniref:uncharacterized protein n=1 Tax=Rhodnius prolixus TaxID=13249 RepID=UPI003D18A4B0